MCLTKYSLSGSGVASRMKGDKAMRLILVIATIFYLGCEHDHAEYTLREHDHDLITHTHPFTEHSHKLVEHTHPLQEHAHNIVEHRHSGDEHVHFDVQKQLSVLERFRKHTHTDLFSQLTTHDHDTPKLTHDGCPIPDFDVDWKGVGYFDFGGISWTDRKPRGELILSNGTYGAIATVDRQFIYTSDWKTIDYDIVLGGWVQDAKRIILYYVAIDSTDGSTIDKPDGRITPNEVTRLDVGESKILLTSDNMSISIDLDIHGQGFNASSSSSGGCSYNNQQYAPELVERLLPLANDLIEILTEGL